MMDFNETGWLNTIGVQGNNQTKSVLKILKKLRYIFDIEI